MNTVKIEENDNEEEKTNIIPLQLITGGKGGGENWLNNLDLGTIFLVKAKAKNLGQNTMVLGQYEIVQKIPHKAVLLYNGLEKNLAWFDPRSFSNIFELVDVLGIAAQQQQETDGDDNNG